MSEIAPAMLRLTVRQLWLLRAATLPGPNAVEAFERWITRVDVAALDRGSYRLLPLLWHNLIDHDVRHPVMPLLKGVYRHTWFGNQVRLGKLRAVSDALADAGVPLLALKGVALAHGVYQNPGLRPMDDLDVLVHPADVGRSLQALRDHGWTTPVARPDQLLEVVNGTELHDAEWERLDLHGHILPGGLRTELDARRWGRAVLVDTGETAFLTLDPTDQLLHTIVHGALADPPAIRWIADALTILRRFAGGIHWERMLADAEAEQYGHVVATRLIALAGLLDAPVPIEVVDGLYARHSSAGERLATRIETGPPVFFAGRLARRWLDYRRWRADPAPSRASVGFRSYLQRVWSVPEAREMPGQVVRHAADRLRLDVSRARTPAGSRRDS